ncbi:MAG: HEAT repeat domain-containing protein [Deltaproteobacteria bacterium]|nr:HEAT repeat domain-containing protein [Deltaproteobacteria bacterium]
MDRYEAAYCLSSFKGNEKAFEALLSSLHDKDSWVRFAVLNALEDHGDSRAYPKIKNLLWGSYHPKYMEEFNLFEENFVISAIFKTLGKLGEKEAIRETFKYFKKQPDELSTAWILGWDGVKDAAQDALLVLLKDASQEELRSLYAESKDLLLAEQKTPLFGIEDKFAKQMATVFLKSSAQAPDVAAEVLSTLVNQWRNTWRKKLAESLPSQIVTLQGKLEDQGKFIGRLGQLRLVTDQGELISQVHMDVERLSELDTLRGKEVVATGTLQHRRGRSKLYPFVEDAHPLFLELTTIQEMAVERE